MNAKITTSVTTDHKLTQLRNRLLHDLYSRTEDPSLYFSFEMVADDAVRVASLTPFPLLFLPGIFEEKAQAVIDARKKGTQTLPNQRIPAHITSNTTDSLSLAA